MYRRALLAATAGKMPPDAAAAAEEAEDEEHDAEELDRPPVAEARLGRTGEDPAAGPANGSISSSLHRWASEEGDMMLSAAREWAAWAWGRLDEADGESS